MEWGKAGGCCWDGKANLAIVGQNSVVNDLIIESSLRIDVVYALLNFVLYLLVHGK